MIEYQGVIYTNSVAFYCAGMVSPNERSCFAGLSEKDCRLQKHNLIGRIMNLNGLQL
uniref:Uncharacterized protein n=1 Tax=Siphoviridae sp. ctxMM9 TaxID=2827973 RepID=A0A8S5T6I1_9CAUD|nr:MAG TPA: hypothetical protein [Siphoviridae sp. ctxMM9]